MKKGPTNQKQHKLPEVYLKKWGYLKNGTQAMVSVFKIGEKQSRQKSVGSFLAETNIFDIDDTIDHRIPRLFEELNSEFDNRYNNIVNELEDRGSLSEEHYAILLQFIPNIMCRSDYWRNWCLGLLNDNERRENFVRSITAQYAKESGDINLYWNTHPFYLMLLHDEPNKIINRVLMLFIGHILIYVGHFEITFLKSQEDKFWSTTDNPVIVENKPKGRHLIGTDSEFYFPLSPKFLAYLHYPKSKSKENPLRHLEINQVHEAEEKHHLEIRELSLFGTEYVIFPGKFEFRGGENESDFTYKLDW